MAVAWTQVSYRIRNDDGGEISAAWRAAVGVDTQLRAGVPFRIRFDVSETGTTAATLTGQLFVSKNGAAYQAVNATSTIANAVASQNGVNNATTTQIISAGTFVAGNIDAVDGLCSVTGSIVQNAHTELEFCVQINPNNVTGGDLITFRVYVSPNTALGTYTKTPTITVLPANALNNYKNIDAGSGLSVTEKIN